MRNIRKVERRFAPAGALLAGALCLLACGDDAEPTPSARTSDAGSGDTGTAPTPPCEQSRIGVLRVAAWPGGGVQVALSVSDVHGDPRADIGARDVRLQRASGERVDLTVRARPDGSGLTALLIVPSADSAEHAVRIETARALVEALPTAERVAVFVDIAGLPLAADLTVDHDHVQARLTAIAPAQPDAIAIERRTAEIAARLQRVSDAGESDVRSVIAIGAALPLGEAASDDVDAGGPGAAPGLRVRDGALEASIASFDDPVAGARALARRISEQRGSAQLLGACGPFTAGEALRLSVDGASCELRAPEPAAELASAACDATAAAEDAYPYADTIDLVFNDDQLAQHDALAAAQSEDDFALQVVFGDGDPIEATAHFRGQTSLECDRKSYSVNLQGARGRRIAPGIINDEFHLISMCKEHVYFRQVLAARLMRSLGLFPLDERYVRLRVAGRERGVYLLLEKPVETLPADNLDVTAVVRRRLDATHEKPEVRFPDTPDAMEQALVRYRAVAQSIDETAPELLREELKNRMDLDGYLRWLALNTYLHNGDSADEMFFYASDESGAAGAEWYFRQTGWDSDDLFHDCHHSGNFAYGDEGGLLYCAESDIDRALLVSPPIYARFVDVLDDLLRVRLPEDVVAAQLEQTRSDLFAHLQDDAVCGAMQELIARYPDATQCDTARAHLDEEMLAFRDRLHARALELQAAIEAWRLR